MNWAAGMIVAAVLLAGCDSGADDAGRTGGTTSPGTITSITGQAFVEQADELCGRLAAKVIDLDVQRKSEEILSGNGSDEEKQERIADLLAQQLTAISDFRRGLEDLGPPPTASDDVDRILVKTRSAESALSSAIAALKGGDEEEFNSEMKRYAGFALQSGSIARDSELNFAVSGSGA